MKTSNALSDLLEKSLTGRGARLLSGQDVKALIDFTQNKPFMLARVEAKRMEEHWQRDMAEYPIYGCLQKSGKGADFDKHQMVLLFLKFDKEAQANEPHDIKYDIWMSKTD